MDKAALVAQLVERVRASARTAEAASDAAAEEAREGATPAEKREDSRTALEFSRLAHAQAKRAAQARADVATLEAFRPAHFRARGTHRTSARWSRSRTKTDRA